MFFTKVCRIHQSDLYFSLQGKLCWIYTVVYRLILVSFILKFIGRVFNLLAQFLHQYVLDFSLQVNIGNLKYRTRFGGLYFSLQVSIGRVGKYWTVLFFSLQVNISCVCNLDYRIILVGLISQSIGKHLIFFFI